MRLEGKWLQFQNKSMVTVEDERFPAHYIPDLFTPADLSKRCKHLMVTLLSTEYLMPSLLQMITTDVRKRLPPPLLRHSSSTSQLDMPRIVSFVL